MYSSKSVHLATVELCTMYIMFTESRQGRSEPKVRDEFHFCRGGKKVFFFTGLNGFYLLMLLTE